MEEEFEPPIQHLRIEADWNGNSRVIRLMAPIRLPGGGWVDALYWSHAGSEGPFDIEDLIDAVTQQIRRTNFNERYES